MPKVYTPGVHKIIIAMKKQAIILLTIGAYLLAGCANHTHNHDHDHSHETHQEATHDHAHEGHNHAHEGHNHNHDHAATAHGHDHEDGISLKPVRPRL